MTFTEFINGIYSLTKSPEEQIQETLFKIYVHKEENYIEEDLFL
jgi:hypothetical protein